MTRSKGGIGRSAVSDSRSTLPNASARETLSVSEGVREENKAFAAASMEINGFTGVTKARDARRVKNCLFRLGSLAFPHGMNYTETAYREQLEKKKELTLAQFKRFGVEQLAVYESAIAHYRMRAEFRVWHDEGDLYYVMFDQVTREKYRVDVFPTATKSISDLMPVLIEKVKADPMLKRKLFQIDFLSSLSGETVISLLYHKALDDAWEESVRELKHSLAEEGFMIDIIGRARKQKRVVDRDFVVEKLQVFGKQLIYQQVENSFTQPNGKVAEKMLEWAVENTRDSEGDLLEMYCGNGNFSIALAENFRKVMATELVKPSVYSAQWNIQKNKIENLKIARLSAEEFTEAMQGKREFRRLQKQEIDLSEYNFSTVFVDPPRAGMDEDSVEMIRGYERILYISCNPDTLEGNIDQLADTHELESMALFDQFPYTDHREVGVILKKK